MRPVQSLPQAMLTRRAFAACALCAEAGVDIQYLEIQPFPLKEFSAKTPRIQYAAGNSSMVKALRATIGR